ncbi:hypothetical protein EGR_10399 [Echinococcus granulosus]|uniref:Uncharacterized protein n=1 Tax=Echinococcus granulosus TaxID=6210 RepID=W6U8G1_ECHGR|nr:hypothetical protein EGR_10399 [Echinococcus granulosus]EUB54737.1 hypothetical protein EGR_10399 [Echinococcus granulosus]
MVKHHKEIPARNVMPSHDSLHFSCLRELRISSLGNTPMRIHLPQQYICDPGTKYGSLIIQDKFIGFKVRKIKYGHSCAKAYPGKEYFEMNSRQANNFATFKLLERESLDIIQILLIDQQSVNQLINFTRASDHVSLYNVKGLGDLTSRQGDFDLLTQLSSLILKRIVLLTFAIIRNTTAISVCPVKLNYIAAISL